MHTNQKFRCWRCQSKVLYLVAESWEQKLLLVWTQGLMSQLRKSMHYCKNMHSLLVKCHGNLLSLLFPASSCFPHQSTLSSILFVQCPCSLMFFKVSRNLLSTVPPRLYPSATLSFIFCCLQIGIWASRLLFSQFSSSLGMWFHSVHSLWKGCTQISTSGNCLLSPEGNTAGVLSVIGMSCSCYFAKLVLGCICALSWQSCWHLCGLRVHSCMLKFLCNFSVCGLLNLRLVYRWRLCRSNKGDYQWKGWLGWSVFTSR